MKIKVDRALSNILHTSKLYLKNHSSTVLTFVGATGVVITSVMTVKATVKAIEIINEAECEKKEKLTKSEIIKLTGITYLPPILVGISTIVCIFGANAMNKHQQAALMSAYAVVDNSFKEYKSKLKELYGEEAHNNILNSIMVEKAKNANLIAPCLAANCKLDIDENTSQPVLWYEEFSSRYFEATIEQIISAEYHLNRNFILSGYCLLNELYEFIGLEKTDFGDAVGWTIEDEFYWIDFNHRKAILDDGVECYILESPVGPSADWRGYQYF